MIKIKNRQLYLNVTFYAAMLFYIICNAGCGSKTKTESELNLDENNFQQDFLNKSDRAPTAKTLFALADILKEQGKDADCEFVLKRIIQASPEYLPAYNSLAELYMRQGRISAAIEALHKSLSINANDPLIYNNLGVCMIITKEYEKALDMFTKAASIKPENTRYRMNMAVSLALMTRFEESMALFRQVLPEEEALFNLNVIKEYRKKTLETLS